MKYFIDPTVDCVFKKLLGSEENKNLLIHFLNAVLRSSILNPVIDVEILNPYNEKDFLTDKLSIVDVKAKDSEGRTFQVDIQLSIHPGLKSRILYCWSDIYASQLLKGDDYSKLQPVISIWIITEKLFYESEGFHYHFQIFDPVNRIALNEECAIHIMELSKFTNMEIKNELERWLAFFRLGRDIDDELMPDFMNTKEMRQAMETLKVFSEKEREYHLYQNRMNTIRLQRTIDKEMSRLKQAVIIADKALYEAEEKKQKAEEEKQKAEEEKQKAEEEKQKAEEEKQKAEEEKQKAIKEKEESLKREQALIEKLKQMGVDIDAET
ncbi:conserved hypothetical protein [Desulfamplus magnetovallimortis]|uniref:Transposase n=1 Tax=Desulfamplus magnetovallimortis TaxID=1246637 RepID=A0A1W1HDF3_9BACT|nr:Rpn family recombination-promoting nuclease/putative transposase [Desulfamplus magnetovallimortis]SLM30509.1 conserved hypothetical protein [Desulfamplus magnetovallimortis]